MSAGIEKVRVSSVSGLYALPDGLCGKMRPGTVSGDASADAVLTAGQAAELLQVSTKTVLRLARDGGLPAHKVGRSWRFSRAAILSWLAREEDRGSQ